MAMEGKFIQAVVWNQNMCVMYYLGAGHPLPTTEPWNQATPRFHVVVPAPGTEAIVRGHLRTTCIVYAGSHEGCSCGFAYEPEVDYRASLEGIPDLEVIATCNEDRCRRKQSVASLHAYLQDATRFGPVRLLVTWAGEENVAPRQQLAMTLDDFGGDGFQIERFTVVDVPQRIEPTSIT